MRKRSVWGFLIILAMLVSCQAGKTELPFETIAQDAGFYHGRGHGSEEPAILVIAGLDEIDDPGLGVQFPVEIADQLRQLDYSQSFAILVLHGRIGITGGVSVTVQQVARRDNEVTVQAEFIYPPPESLVKPAFSSPYHLVSVSKQGEWGQEIRFVLVVGGEEVVETEHFIP